MKFFNTEIFPIYGMYVCTYVYQLRTYVYIYIRGATIHDLGVSIYCHFCITIQQY